VGNNAAEVVKAVIDGISAFRDELVTPAALAEVPAEEKNMNSAGSAAGIFEIPEHPSPQRQKCY